jgi:hypothetical protein
VVGPPDHRRRHAGRHRALRDARPILRPDRHGEDLRPRGHPQVPQA